MKLLSWLFRDTKTNTKPGALYAVSQGKYLGEFFVYVKKIDESHHFLSLPKMINRKIPDMHFISGIEKNILEFQEHLPREYTKVCISQFNKNEK